MDRREFLGAWAGLAAGSALGFSPPRRRAGLDRLGLQLYTVRDPLSRDPAGTLERVAEIGYREVEFAGYHGRSAEEMAGLARDAGLDPVSAHVPLDGILNRPEALADASRAAGHEELVLAWVERGRRRMLDDWRRLAGVLNGFGETCRERGLRFAYHNHAYDFEPRDGTLPYEVLARETDPDLVGLQLDLFWLRAGGQEPLEYVRRHGARVPSCHVKDMDARGRMVDVGAGVMEFGPLLAAAVEEGVGRFFVEHDRPPDPLAFARRSFRYLSTLEMP